MYHGILYNPGYIRSIFEYQNKERNNWLLAMEVNPLLITF